MAILCLPVLSAQASPTSDALVIGIQSSKTTSLNPLFPVERDMLSIFDLMYDSLITIDDNYQPQAGLAESWTQTGQWPHMDVHAAARRAVLRRDGNDGERRRRDGKLHHFLRQGHKPDEQGILRQSALLRQGNQGAGQLHGGGARRSAVLRRAVRHDIPGSARERTGKRKSPRHGRVHDYGLHALLQRHEGQP